MINIKNDLDFFVPIDTMKSGTSENKKVAIVSGWASTGDRDFQGEIIEPIGIDASYLFNNGWIDYEHDTELPVGLPTENSYVDPEKGLYLEAKLFQDKPEVKKFMDLYDRVKSLQAHPRLGFSIEGNVIERDEDDPSIIKQILITGVAITKTPANASALWDSIVKSNTARSLHKISPEIAKEFEAGYGVTPDTQTDGAALRKESLDIGVRNLAYTITKLKEAGNFDDAVSYAATSIDGDGKLSNKEDVSALLLQLATGVSKDTALSSLHQDIATNGQIETALDGTLDASDIDNDSD